MGMCTRVTLIILLIIQLVLTFERQIFDFIGFMWAPILVNFFQIIFLIFGLFGAFQYHSKYIWSYCTWNLFAVPWNSFVICFYLDIGSLDKNSDLLNLGTGSVSWWEANGYGCKPYYSPNVTTEDFYRPQRPEIVTGCFLQYTTVEIIHAGIQVSLSIFGLIFGLLFIRVVSLETKLGKSSMKRKPSKRSPFYSVEFSSEHVNPEVNDPVDTDINMTMMYLQNTKPMTPRRVKRRNVQTRGHPHYSSTTRRQGGSGSHHGTMRSTSSRRDTWRRSGHSNPSYQQSSIQSLNDSVEYENYSNRPPSARSTYSNFHGMRHINSTQPQPGISSAHAKPQAPLMRETKRQSLRSMAFLNSGPPAYTLQGSNQLDSETTI